MAKNQEDGHNGGVVDDELAKAQRSMGGRIDGTAPAAGAEEKPADNPEAKPPVNPAPAPVNPQPEVKIGEDITKKPDVVDDGQKPPVVARPATYIPMPKYLNEKKDWETRATTAEERAKIAEAEVERLKSISTQNNGAQKDEEIEAFMEQTGFSREVVEGLLTLAEKRVMKPELVDALNRAKVIVAEADLDSAFAAEFTKDGEPALKSTFPEITAEQIAKAKTFIDQVSHTKEFSDKTLDYVIFKHKDEIAKLFGDAPDTTPPQTKKTIEGARPGGGKPVGLTAKDFVGKDDFSELNDMDHSTRSNLIKSFDDKTYVKFTQWAANQTGGLEVMRNGAKVTLK